jgi:hypothetical protein
MTGERTADAKWRAQRSANGQDRVETVTVTLGARDMTFGEVVDAWRGDAAFRDFFITELARTPYPAFFWEMPPIARDTMDRRYDTLNEHRERHHAPAP